MSTYLPGLREHKAFVSPGAFLGHLVPVDLAAKPFPPSQDVLHAFNLSPSKLVNVFWIAILFSP